MRVLFDHPSPFALAHGGFQTQIEQTKLALRELGVEVDFLRWWDDTQEADLIHYFGVASNSYLEQARARRWPVVMTTLFTETCNRSDRQLRRQRYLTRAILSLPFGEGVKQQLTWRAYHNCTRNVVGLEAERKVLEEVYQVPAGRISVVPLGLSRTYLEAGPGNRSANYLICTGTITQRKNSVELAELAKSAQVPILFVGKPYHPTDAYWQRFEQLIDQKFVKYHPHVGSESEMIGLLQSARGFVLMSRYENWCLAAHEAAACGLPVLLPDQKWSRERFGQHASYLAAPHDPANVKILRHFYEQCPHLPASGVRLYTWGDAAAALKAVYERTLSTSL